MIAVKVESLGLANSGDFVVLLREPETRRTLPVFIGPAEAQAIAFQIENVHVPRPLTHDLLKNMLKCVEWKLKHVEVCDLVDKTFYARLIVEHEGMEKQIDSRPSDAIALALRCGAPIFVHETVMDAAGVVLPEPAAKQAAAPAHAPKPPTPKLTPLEATKKSLEKAIEDERYEDAARLRDEIKGMEKAHKQN